MFWIYFSELCRLIVLYLSSSLLRADGLGVPGGGFPSWAVTLDFGFFAHFTVGVCASRVRVVSLLYFWIPHPF